MFSAVFHIASRFVGSSAYAFDFIDCDGDSIYCSKTCQEAAKDLRTKARGKRQRAEAKKAKAVE